MEHEHCYAQEQQYSGVADQFLQPAWLCVPQIKVEKHESGILHSQALQSNDINSSSSTSSNPSFSNLQCNSQYGKNLPQISSQNGFSDDRGSSESAGFNETEHLSNNQNTVLEISDRSSCPDQASSTPPQYVPTAEDLNENLITDVPLKDIKSHGSLWCATPLQERAFHSPDNEKQLLSSSDHERCGSRYIKYNGTSKTDPREAFDLTCRNKVLSEEEDGSSKISVTECSATAGIQASQRCAPKAQTCKICGKVLSSPSSYYVHLKLHSGNKPYACQVCEASFCRKPYLEVHMRTHTGERPFECDTCNKRFTQKSSLNTHKRVHTGERPYSCDICQKTFAVKSYVTAHRWSHVSEKPLECQRCGLTFTSKSSFSLHIRTHIDHNHECHICGRTFMKDSYLIRHQNRVHKELNTSDDPRSPALSPSSLSSSCRSIASQ